MPAADVIAGVVDSIGTQAATAMGALVPVGQAVTGSFVVLSILMLGASLVSGGAAFIGPLVRLCAASAGTYWAVSYWPDITLGTLRAARAAAGLLIGGYSGPASLFGMANDTAGRIITESQAALSFTDLGSIGNAVASAIAALAVWFGLSVTGLLAILAEFELLIGAAVAPLVLPALAFGLTRSIGFGPVQYMVGSGVRVVVMAVVSHIMARAATAAVAVPGADGAYSFEAILTLLGVAALTAVCGLSCNGLARSVVGGSPGALGLGAAFAPARGVAAATVAGAGVAVGAVKGGAAVVGAARAFGGGAGPGGSAPGSSGGPVGGAPAGAPAGRSRVGVSSGRGSAFS